MDRNKNIWHTDTLHTQHMVASTWLGGHQRRTSVSTNSISYCILSLSSSSSSSSQFNVHFPCFHWLNGFCMRPLHLTIQSPFPIKTQFKHDTHSKNIGQTANVQNKLIIWQNVKICYLSIWNFSPTLLSPSFPHLGHMARKIHHLLTHLPSPRMLQDLQSQVQEPM